MKIALVHDYLREYGGAERVVEALHELFPDAPLYTSFVDWEALGSFADRFRGWDIRTSWVQRNWLVKKYHSPLRFLTPLVWESFNFDEFDIVISSSGWYMCRGVVTRPETLHISYIHHPPRNLYGYPTGTRPNMFIRMYSSLINPFLRMYDFATIQRVDYLVANSEETRARIKKFYRRDSTVIYPPVDVIRDKREVISKKNVSRISYYVSPGYFLSVGRLTYAKRIDLAIEACNRLQVPLKVVGTGKEEGYLRAIAARPPSASAEGAAGWRPTIEFVGTVSDEELDKLYRGAKALIFCALQEDFGIVPVEAMGHGVPVIALKQGGVIETVVEGKTGLFFEEPTVESLVAVLNKFYKDYKHYNFYTACQKQAQKFSKEVFLKKMKAFVEEKWSSFDKKRPLVNKQLQPLRLLE